MEDTKNNNLIQAIDDEQAENISGGREGLFPSISFKNTWCDFCGSKIDGQKRFSIPLADKNKAMCNLCFEKQKAALGQDAANEVWLGIKAKPTPPGRPNQNK